MPITTLMFDGNEFSRDSQAQTWSRVLPGGTLERLGSDSVPARSSLEAKWQVTVFDGDILELSRSIGLEQLWRRQEMRWARLLKALASADREARNESARNN